jgi:hypothetical protein
MNANGIYDISEWAGDIALKNIVPIKREKANMYISGKIKHILKSCRFILIPTGSLVYSRVPKL